MPPRTLCLRATLLLLAIGRIAHAQDCERVVDVPVYDSAGHRLAWTIDQILPSGFSAQNAPEPANRAAAGFHPRIEGQRITGLTPGREYVLRLRGPDGQTALRKLPVFYTCRQRASQVMDLSPPRGSIGDSEHDAVRGRFTNCRFAGDWWVRLTPMHGPPQGSDALEGSVQEDGLFEIPGHFPSARYTIVLGRGSEPVFVSAVNLQRSNSPTNLPPISIAGACPASLKPK
jgi:hypothetical protein